MNQSFVPLAFILKVSASQSLTVDAALDDGSVRYIVNAAVIIRRSGAGAVVRLEHFRAGARADRKARSREKPVFKRLERAGDDGPSRGAVLHSDPGDRKHGGDGP